VTTDAARRCLVCARQGAFEGGICDECKAKIRGEVLDRKQREKKDADRALHKEGTAGDKKSGG